MTEPRPDRVRVSGPLAVFADGFHVQLVEQGYRPGSVLFHLQLLAHLSRWMQAAGVDVVGLSPGVVEQFLVERRDQGTRAGSRRRGRVRCWTIWTGSGCCRLAQMSRGRRWRGYLWSFRLPG